MSGSDGSPPKSQPGDRKGDATRAERLRMALRENLKRRKSQARGRSQTHDSAGFVPENARGKAKDESKDEPEDAPEAGDKSHDSAGITGHKQRS